MRSRKKADPIRWLATRVKARVRRGAYYICYDHLQKSSIFFPPPPNRAAGGPTTFLSLFRNALSRHGVVYSNDFWCRPDLVFFPTRFDCRLLRFWKKRDVRIVQRLDG